MNARKQRDAILPLPKGEGRGEGKQHDENSETHLHHQKSSHKKSETGGIAQFFVEHREVSWLALIAVLVWGGIALQSVSSSREFSARPIENGDSHAIIQFQKNASLRP